MAGACICWPHLGGSRCQASRILAGAAETGARATGTASESVSNCSRRQVLAPDPHLVIAAVLAASLSGCATTSDPVGGATSNQLAINPFDQPGARPDVFLAGRLEGTLTSDGRCVIVVQAAQSVTPLWPGGHDGARCRRARDGEPARRPRKRGAGKARNPQRRSISRRRCGKTGRRRASQLPRALLRGRYRGLRSHAIPRLQPPRASLGRRERRRLAAAENHAHAQATQPRRRGELRRVTRSPPSPAAAQPARAPRPARDRA